MWGKAPRSWRAQRAVFLLSTKYRLIVTSSSDAASIAANTRFEGRLPILLKRSFTVLIASVGSARTAGRDERNVTSTISATAEAMRLHRFLTLTLDPKRIEGDPVRYLNDAFAKLRVYLKRELHVAPQYIRVLEFQKNGNPHFHILIDQYIDLGWIRKAWVAVGGGFMVDIRCVDVHRVSRYLSKYLTKELLLSAPSRSRRVTTSRGITLLAQTPQKTIWTLVKVPIFRLFEVYARDVVTSSVDEDQLLESFTAILGATA